MFQSVLFWVAALILVVWTVSAVQGALGNRQLKFLRDIPPLDRAGAPRVSIVIAARNEERNIGQALRSVLAQDYPNLEVIVVDDRSSDATGVILDGMEFEFPRLRVVHVDTLPPGWLGKNHALQRGTEAARGEWILFTDADVVMEASTVARAVNYAQREGFDHITLAPEMKMPSAMLDLFAGSFAIFFSQYARPWKARDPRSRAHVGIGAFNLLRTSVYRAIQGHTPIRMRPDDDLKLGKLVKQNGYRQDVLFGRGSISVEWYSSVPEAVRGLEKNAFAGVGYSVLAVVASALALLLFNVWPFVAVFVTEGPTRWLYLGTVAVILGLYVASTRVSGANPLYGFAFPIATLLFLFMLVRSTVLALVNGGIQWRDTYYSLEQLRANRI